ncbi:TPA: phosphoglucosamine mutase, partial [Candidatus Woesearchaeota archaeon]|nr:phosphoglucosamine mutase [Candidatus Woesearchaeota archaeon]
AKKIEELDGLKIYLDDDTWVLFRPSGNAPEFRVFAEARSKERAKELVGEGVKDVQTLIHSSHSSHP